MSCTFPKSSQSKINAASGYKQFLVAKAKQRVSTLGEQTRQPSTACRQATIHVMASSIILCFIITPITQAIRNKLELVTEPKKCELS